MKGPLSVIVFLLCLPLFAQQVGIKETLLERAKNNFEHLKTNPEEVYHESQKIEREAKEANAKEAELYALMTQCDYYRLGNDFEDILKSADKLYITAKNYKFPIYQAVAKYNLFEAYFFTDLTEKAYQQAEEGINIIENIDETDSFTVKIKTNLYFAFTNYFSLKKDYENQFKYLIMAGDEFQKMESGDLKQKYLNTYYSNLASYYLDVEQLDSVHYYAELSLEEEKGFNRGYVEFFNCLLLGEAEMKRGDYRKALEYFGEAEKIDGYKNHINVDELYKNIIESNKQLGETELSELYKSKLDSLKLTVVESQKSSLYSLLIKRDGEKPNRILIYLASLLIIIMGGIIFWVVRKNRILAKQEKVSQKYLDEVSGTLKGGEYSKLIKVLKENDAAFMLYFNEIFPDFSVKLLEVNPKLSESEIEFCALLKLKLATKEIARYKFIAPKTVLNKKYLIRNKLNIPKGTDIYYWLDNV